MISLSDETSNKKKQIFEKVKNKIKEEYKIEIKDEIKEEKKPEEKMHVIDVNEKIILEEKKPKEESEQEIENSLTIYLER